MAFLGLADSPAETPTMSVPVILNAANTSALITPKTPLEKAPGSFQYLKPYTVPLIQRGVELTRRWGGRAYAMYTYPMTPPEVKHPIMTKTTTQMILTRLNQYSASPQPRAP